VGAELDFDDYSGKRQRLTVVRKDCAAVWAKACVIQRGNVFVRRPLYWSTCPLLLVFMSEIR
jgi:hypothetical protein